MARPKSLSLLSVDALFKLRDDVASALAGRADALKKELAAIGSDYAEVGRIAIYGKKKASSLKGRKAPIKYRDKAGNHWLQRAPRCGELQAWASRRGSRTSPVAPLAHWPR
jgi:hypothetical protein